MLKGVRAKWKAHERADGTHLLSPRLSGKGGFWKDNVSWLYLSEQSGRVHRGRGVPKALTQKHNSILSNQLEPN